MDAAPRGVLALLEHPELVTGKITREPFALHPQDLSWHNGTGILTEDVSLERTNAFLTQGGGLVSSEGVEPPRPIWVSVRGVVYDVTCE